MNEALFETIDSLKEVTIFASKTKQHAFLQLGKRLIGGAGERLVRWKLQDYSDFKVINNFVLPSSKTQNGRTQIDHLVISRKGIFPIETKTRNLVNGEYYAENSESKTFQRQLLLYEVAIYEQLKRYADSTSRLVRQVVQKVLQQQVVFNVLLVVNRDQWDQQKFPIDQPDFYDSGTSSIKICNLTTLPDYLKHAGEADFAFSPKEMEILAEILQPKPRLTDVNRDTYLLFPQIKWNFADYPGNAFRIRDCLETVNRLAAAMKQLEKLMVKLPQLKAKQAALIAGAN